MLLGAGVMSELLIMVRGVFLDLSAPLALAVLINKGRRNIGDGGVPVCLFLNSVYRDGEIWELVNNHTMRDW